MPDTYAWEDLMDVFIDTDSFQAAMWRWAEFEGWTECFICGRYTKEIETTPEGKEACSDCAEKEEHERKVANGEIIEVAPGQMTVDDFYEGEDIDANN